LDIFCGVKDIRYSHVASYSQCHQGGGDTAGNSLSIAAGVANHRNCRLRLATNLSEYGYLMFDMRARYL
jgi:hypothetical protein